MQEPSPSGSISVLDHSQPMGLGVGAPAVQSNPASSTHEPRDALNSTFSLSHGDLPWSSSLSAVLPAPGQSDLCTHKAPTAELTRRSTAFSNKIPCMSSQAPIMVLEACKAVCSVKSGIQGQKPQITVLLSGRSITQGHPFPFP